jgi:REP-associated tyrosine transposase
MIDQNYHSKNLRQHRSYEKGVFFVTKCIQPRKPLLLSEYRKIISEALIFYARQEKITLAAFVVMPDHWHLLCAPNHNQSISQTIASVQGWLSRHTGKYLQTHGVIWQKSFHETKIRSSKQFSYVCQYIENNPVSKGLVGKKSEWSDSSANDKYIDGVQRPWAGRFEYD